MVRTAQAVRDPQTPPPTPSGEQFLTHPCGRGRSACSPQRSMDLAAQALRAPRPAPGVCPSTTSTLFQTVHPVQAAHTQTLTEYVGAPVPAEEPQRCGGRSPACGGRGLQAATGTSRRFVLAAPGIEDFGPLPASDCWRRASAACDVLAMVQSNRRGGTLAFRDALGRLRDALAACPVSATREAAYEQRGPQLPALGISRDFLAVFLSGFPCLLQAAARRWALHGKDFKQLAACCAGARRRSAGRVRVPFDTSAS